MLVPGAARADTRERGECRPRLDWRGREDKASHVDLCVCINARVHRRPSTAQELDCHFSSQTNGLFIKLKAAISIRKYSIPAIRPEG